MHNLTFFSYYLLMKMNYKIISIINIIFILLTFSLVNNKKLNKTIHNIAPITICIDPGHGGKDGGAIYDGYVEKDINLEISLKLKKVLEEEGYEVVLTRDKDYHLPKDLEYTKAGDLNERIKIINESNAFMLISIHANKYSSPIVHGAQVFYKSTSRESMVLAALIQKNIVNSFENNNRVSKSIDTIYLLNAIDIPAVIVESGFMSNPNDLKNITNDEFQEEFSKVISKSINEYLLYY